MSKRSRTAACAWIGAAALAVMASGQPALGQSSQPKDDPNAGQPNPPAPRKAKSVRKAVVDLQGQAQERRPGQVLPGDTPPVGTKAAAEAVRASEPAAPAPASRSRPPAIGLPDSGAPARPMLRPDAESGARPTMPDGAHAPAPPPAPSAPVNSAAPTGKPTPRLAADSAGSDVPLVDRAVLGSVPMPLSTADAKVRVESVPEAASGAQWRAGADAWKTLAKGETAEGRIEVRAGLDADVVLSVDDHVQVRVARLGRAMIERCVEPGGTTSVSVVLSRGAVEIRPIGEPSARMFARVRTPDQSFGVVGPVRVEYDAFTGTRRRVVNP